MELIAVDFIEYLNPIRFDTNSLSNLKIKIEFKKKSIYFDFLIFIS
jgi:hypothetical protein